MLSFQKSKKHGDLISKSPYLFGARGGTRTPMVSRMHLKHVRLPIPPHAQNMNRQNLTFPSGRPPSIISATELNFCVRDGYRCVLFAFVTGLNHFTGYLLN